MARFIESIVNFNKVNEHKNHKMGTKYMRTIGYIASGVVVGSSLVIASSAIAGGFAIREQSTTGLGAAFADSAAGSDLSSMFWNPAAVTTQDGMNSLSSFTVIVPDTEIDLTAGSTFGAGGTTMDTLGLLAGSYFNYQISPKLYVGASINAPFGLVTEANDPGWGGATYNRKSEMLTFNVAPTVGYKVTPGISIAAGLQVEYIKARLASAAPVAALFATDIVIKGDDVAVGYTLGALFEPTSSTKIGVGFRSSIKHKLDGTIRSHAAVGLNDDVTAKLDTPEMVTASIRQQVTPSLALMVNYEWSNWSRLSELRVVQDGGGADVVEDFSWEDSWFVSGGAEMMVGDALTVRTGLGYEKTPVPSTTRSARLPDSDRIWLSFGGSYKWSETTTLDFGYSHIFFKDSKIAQTAKGALFADVENSADIISIGMRHKW
ncbi:MAG: transporter [bacterium]|nr:transporter [bacterium]